jgi:hypothetical protein
MPERRTQHLKWSASFLCHSFRHRTHRSHLGPARRFRESIRDHRSGASVERRKFLGCVPFAFPQASGMQVARFVNLRSCELHDPVLLHHEVDLAPEA